MWFISELDVIAVVTAGQSHAGDLVQRGQPEANLLVSIDDLVRLSDRPILKIYARSQESIISFTRNSNAAWADLWLSAPNHRIQSITISFKNRLDVITISQVKRVVSGPFSTGGVEETHVCQTWYISIHKRSGNKAIKPYPSTYFIVMEILNSLQTRNVEEKIKSNGINQSITSAAALAVIWRPVERWITTINYLIRRRRLEEKVLLPVVCRVMDWVLPRPSNCWN